MFKERILHSNHRRILIIFSLLTVMVTAAFSGGAWWKGNEEDVIATVNGSPIHVEEFQRAIRLNKSAIMNYFRDQHHADQSETFWTTSFDGEIPIEMLKKKALDDCVRLKVRLLQAKDLGILQDISYPGFLRQLQQENHRRAEAIKNRQVVYGPERYDEDTYLEYLLTNSTLAVKQHLQQNALKQGESSLRLFYEEHKDQRYRTRGYVTVQRISRTILDSNHQIDPALEQKVKRLFEEAHARLLSGASFEDVAAAYAAPGTELELTIDLGDERRNARSPVAQTAAKLSVQEISQIIEDNGSLHLLKCIEKVEPDSAYLAYEQVKNQVLQDYVNGEYETKIREMTASAQVLRHDKLYQSFQM
ncbi:peptidylprolyl isomerase [Paenibacillus sp. A3]|uniref:SurA N-terminal domain-containing protein n=1 Tax=Paenibacillus sp. A3 TaxID=1337054 RepID=UPI0006D596FD|nr:peptidyl-prolyl cis-trans isomerase [Paenibacillus sp. A3]KPV57646.1 peptidylprolyl isomerase [Paenibacillus sp. A3]